MGKRTDITGQTFNYLTAIKPVRYYGSQHRMIWEFLCRCGKHVESGVSSVKIGNRKSCGCLKRSKGIAFLTGRNRKDYGVSCKNIL